MKKSLFITLALAIGVSSVAVAGVHVVGGTANSANTFPFYGSHPGHRWQTMWFQSEINESGKVTKVEWQCYTTPPVGGTFNNCDILLCHTGISAITSTFANNYGGKTPVTVFKGTYVLPRGTSLAWMTIVSPTNFTYNNSDNLLIEVSWQGGTTGTNFFRVRTSGSNFPGRVWNSTSKTATTGSVQTTYHHIGRITIEPTAVAPTSLGRVKSIFR